MAPLTQILHLEDDPADAELIQAKMEEADLACRITRVQTRDEFDDALNRGGYDIILADYRLPTYDGMSALRLAQEKCPEIPVIFVSGTMGEEAAIEGLTQGATDYVLKHNLSRLASAVRRALQEARNQHERRQAQEALQRSNEMLRAIIEAAPVAIIGLDLDGNVCSVWNPAAEKMSGWSAQDVMGRPLPTVAPDDQKEFKRFREQIRKGMTLDGVEVRRQRRDGTPIDFSIYASPLHDAEGRIGGNIAVMVDITEHKQAEREHLASLKFFECMDKVNRAIQGIDDQESLMSDMLDIVLSIFDCDRAFLVYPCDPASPTWTSPMERNKPEYPGLADLKMEMPMDPQVAEKHRILLAADGPVAFGPGAPHGLPEDVSKQFDIKSLMAMAIYPKTGRAWEFGIQQCTHARIWTAEEMRMLEAIGRRLADSLSSLLSYRDLRKNEEFLDNVVEHIPNMIFVKDAQTLRFVRFNRAGEQLVGYSRQELLGKTDHDFFPKEEADFFTAKDRQVLESKELVDIAEETIRNSRDEERILHTKKIPILDEAGTPQYLLGISEDITDRKQAEASIRKLSQAIEQSPVSIVITDAAGNIEFVNTKFSQITGYSYAEALGQNPRILKSGETPAEDYKRLWATIRSGGVWSGEFHNRKKNGKLFWEQATIAPVRNADNVITHYVAVKEDITERKKLEAQLRQAQKMEAIGTLAGGIAHDFNNILSAIIGFTELAMDTIGNDSLAHSDLQQVLNAGRRAKELVFQILTFSRQREQKQKSPVNIKHLAKEVLKLIRASLPTNIEIRDNLESNSPVNADPTQIHQVLMNLCTNAGHAMQEKGGILEMSLSDIELDSDFGERYPDLASGQYLKLTVSDTGCGMSADVLERIFDPFFTTKAEGEGTGLGLSMVHGIVKSHGGIITVYSEPGQGTTFNILLPVRKIGIAPEHTWEENIPTGTEHILFIDDETVLTELGARILQSLGYEVTTRTSGLEALELFKAQPDRFDLVITDLTMPHITGDRIAEAMMQIRADIPIILCTGFSSRINEKKAITMGIRELVFKPIVISDLARKIRMVLDQPGKER
jgi:PAS domain S-box-containing protein